MKKVKKSKKRARPSLKDRLLRRWRNGSLRVKELSRMEFGKILISKKEAFATLRTLDAMAQAAIDRSPLAMAGAQANMYPLGHGCRCSVCHPPRGPYATGLGTFFGRLF